MQQNVKEKQARTKEYVDEKRHAKTTNIKVGDEVLVKQKKTNKFTPKFRTQPLIVTQVAGTRITATNPGDSSTITRNISHFKKYQRSSEYHREYISGDEMTDDELGYQPQVPTELQRTELAGRYPRRERTRPKYYVPE